MIVVFKIVIAVFCTAPLLIGITGIVESRVIMKRGITVPARLTDVTVTRDSDDLTTTYDLTFEYTDPEGRERTSHARGNDYERFVNEHQVGDWTDIVCDPLNHQAVQLPGEAAKRLASYWFATALGLVLTAVFIPAILS